MVVGHGIWSLGIKFGLPAFILTLLILLAVIGLLVAVREPESAVTVGAVFLILIVGAVIALWPFNSEYHKWYTVRGTVEMTNKRMISDGKAMSERYVVKFQESDTLYGCDDTRCALASPGKRLTLSCKREWQYNAVAGWACNYKQEN